jgi:hypothetical protein
VHHNTLHTLPESPLLQAKLHDLMRRCALGHFSPCNQIPSALSSCLTHTWTPTLCQTFDGLLFSIRNNLGTQPDVEREQTMEEMKFSLGLRTNATRLCNDKPSSGRFTRPQVARRDDASNCAPHILAAAALRYFHQTLVSRWVPGLGQLLAAPRAAAGCNDAI